MNLMMRIMNIFLPDCETVSHLTSHALDEELPFRKKIGMKIHIMFCEFCKNNAKQLRLMKDLIHKGKTTNRIIVDKTDISLSSDAKKRISDILNQSDKKD